VPDEAAGENAETHETSVEEATPQAPAASAAESEPKPERLPLVVIDADAGERARVEGFADALGRPVHAIAPDSVLPSSLAEFARGAGVVVAWDLGGRSGLDLLDAIARVAGATRPRMALAAEGATRAMVVAAVRTGAQGFLSRPYDADELGALLEGVS
jgi:ActR/RegA family two-component response regulator